VEANPPCRGGAQATCPSLLRRAGATTEDVDPRLFARDSGSFPISGLFGSRCLVLLRRRVSSWGAVRSAAAARSSPCAAGSWLPAAFEREGRCCTIDVGPFTAGSCRRASDWNATLSCTGMTGRRVAGGRRASRGLWSRPAGRQHKTGMSTSDRGSYCRWGCLRIGRSRRWSFRA